VLPVQLWAKRFEMKLDEDVVELIGDAIDEVAAGDEAFAEVLKNVYNQIGKKMGSGSDGIETQSPSAKA
jgi:hypothetical protein